MKIAVVDDEIKYQEEIRALIEQFNPKINVSMFNSAEDFLKEDIYQFTIIFLDIEMERMNGVELAQVLRENKSRAVLFFVTSHSNYITSALKSIPFQYIIKPIDPKVFIAEFKRAINIIKKSRIEIQLTWNGEKSFVKIDSIEYLEYTNRKVTVYCQDGKIYESNGKIKDYMEKLNIYSFEQSHNSFLVNLAKASKNSGYEIVMKSGKIVPLSKKYYVQFREQYRVYLSGVVIC